MQISCVHPNLNMSRMYVFNGFNKSTNEFTVMNELRKHNQHCG